jgi:putative hydrolase of the HAD superfamily
MTIEAVIFDYGGVISSPFLRDIGSFEEQMGYPPGSVHLLMFGDSHGHPEREADLHDFHRLEMGTLSLQDYLLGLVRRAPEIVGKPIDFVAYQEFTRSTPVSVHWPVVQRIQRLHTDGVRLGLLTNNVKEFGATWRSTFPAAELFQVIVDSCEVGMRKPDPRIYELTCEQLGVAPTAAVFIDDNVDNIDAANALGIETVHFGEPLDALVELDAILKRRGARSVEIRSRRHPT